MRASLLDLACAAYSRLLAAGGRVAPLPDELLARVLARLVQSGQLCDAVLARVLAALPPACTALTLAAAVRLTDASLARLAHHCPHLTTLNRAPPTRSPCPPSPHCGAASVAVCAAE